MYSSVSFVFSCFFFQAEDGIRDLVRSRGLGDVYKRQLQPLLDDLVALLALDVRHETDTAGVVFVGGIVQALSLIHI